MNSDKTPGLPTSTYDWTDFVLKRWAESVGLNPSRKYNSLTTDLGFEFFKAVSSFRTSLNTSDEKKGERAARKCAEAAGKFVEASVACGNIDNIRNLFEAMNSIKSGGRSRVEGHANDQVGRALVDFIEVNDRLPATREELRNFPGRESREYDLLAMTKRSLSDALVYYSLNEMIRDKTGPKPR